MINWNKYFDHIFCIHYISEDRIERHNQLIKELKRVGIYDNKIFEFIYDIDNSFSNIIYNNEYLLKRFKCLDYEKNSKYALRVTINHLQALYISKLLGYNRILILEDDICFLKDLNKIEEILENNINSLKQYNLCLYDYIDYDLMYVFADCYALNTDGINILIDNITNNYNKDIYVIDTYFTKSNPITLYSGEYSINIDLPKLLNITTCGEIRLGLQRNNFEYNDSNINYNDYQNHS